MLYPLSYRRSAADPRLGHRPGAENSSRAESSRGPCDDLCMSIPTLPAPSDPAVVWIERTGSSTFRGRNSRGATVEIAPITHDGAFTAGELLKVALAGCAGLTADSALARRLGDEFPATITAAGLKDQEADRYPALTEELIVDLSGLEPEERERVITVVNRAIDAHCAVRRTLAAGARVELRIVDPT